jgi:hypothetical protein
MTTRDEAILGHIGLYRLTLRATLERLFFGGGRDACDNVLRRLAAEGRLRPVSGLPGRVSYYQLTAAEAGRRGLPANRAATLRPQALQLHLAVLWFCCMTPSPRVRLEPAELRTLEPAIPFWPQLAHCVEGGAFPRVYRVEVLGPRARTGDLIARTRRRLAQALAVPELAPLVRHGRYAVAVLTGEDARRPAVEAALERRGLRRRAHIIVEHAPAPTSLPKVLHDPIVPPGPRCPV